jgi:hypothetical protein
VSRHPSSGPKSQILIKKYITMKRRPKWIGLHTTYTQSTMNASIKTWKKDNRRSKTQKNKKKEKRFFT